MAELSTWQELPVGGIVRARATRPARLPAAGAPA